MMYYIIAALTFSLGLLVLRIRAQRKAHQAWVRSCLVDRLVEACFLEEHYREMEDPYGCEIAVKDRFELQRKISLL